MRNRLVSVVLALFALGCDETFNPVKDYHDQLIVYSILDTFADTQYVRVYSTYNPPGHNAANQQDDSPIANAQVRIDDVSKTWSFSDTLLPRPAGSKYTSDLQVYYNPQFRPQPGGLYLLDVGSSIGTVSAVVRVPASAYVYSSNISVLQLPLSSPTTQRIEVKSVLAPETFAFVMRLFLEYEVAVPGGWAPGRIQVPLSISRADTVDNIQARYPSLHERSTDPVSNQQSPKPDVTVFSNGVYRTVIDLLRRKYPPGVIRFLKARIELIQTDEDFYTYTKVVAGFEDQNSVRTDEPDFTNVAGGRGLFGVIARDTISYPVAYNLGL